MDNIKTEKQLRPWSRSPEEEGINVYPGVVIFPKISGSQSNGEFSGMLEHVSADYKGAPHVHYEASETIIMTEGEVHMRISGEDITLKNGDWVHIPPGHPHSFKSSGEPAKWLILLHPGDPDEGTDGPKPPPPEVLADRELADKYTFDNMPDFISVPNHGFPGDPK